MDTTGPGARARPPVGPASPARERDHDRRRLRALVEAATGTAALVGGGLMAVRPDGSLLGLPEAMLDPTPFTDWRVPGLLLAGLVGAGFVVAAALEHTGHRRGPAVSSVAGAGLVVFELVEWGWIGFHPLQAVFLLVGAGVLGSAVAGSHLARGRPGGRRHDRHASRPTPRTS